MGGTVYMKLWKYKNYEEYKKNQISASERKWKNSFYDPNGITLIVNYLRGKIDMPCKGVCHGTRDGDEVLEFRKLFGSSDIFGTEINPRTKDISHTMEWDFNVENPEWESKFDFIYSNSFDHSHNPSNTLKVWMNSLKPNGFCVIEWTQVDGENWVSGSDPFGASLDEYVELITKLNFKVVDILETNPENDKSRSHHPQGSNVEICRRHMIMIQHKFLEELN